MIDVAYFTAFILVFIRISTFLILVPIFFPKGTPNTLKVAFTGIVAFILLPMVDYSSIGVINSNYTLIASITGEIVTGLTLGFITNLCFFSIRMAGQLIDFQIGLSMVNLFDPSSNSSTTIIEHLLYWTSLVMFLIIDGHHILIKALAESFNIIHLGKFILTNESIMIIIKAFIEFFAIGLKIAIPIVLIILMTDITLGLVSRTVPQLNVMVLGLPVKILVGLTTIAFALPLLLKMIMTSFNTLPDVLKGLYKAIPLMIIFSSDDKTEEATPKKKSEARKKGQVPRSKEVGLAITLLATTLIFLALGTYISKSLMATLNTFLGSYLNTKLDYNSVQTITLVTVWRIAIVFLPVVLPIMVAGIIANYIQVGFMITKDPLKPQLSKLNPLKGFQRIFSKRTFIELLKDILIIIIVGYVAYGFFKDNYQSILNFGNLRTTLIMGAFAKVVINLLTKISMVMIVIALADYIYQRFQFNKELRMTKQEVKEEYKQQEGNPEVKSKIKQKQRQMATRRMMQQIPSATVVVTNPTHVAVALKYVEGEDEAPKVVAKGLDSLALKIKEKAKEHDVPVIENKTLARLMYSEVEVDSVVPMEMYQAIAEILALVYKLKKRK